MESSTDDLRQLSLTEAGATSEDDDEEAAEAEPQVQLAFLEEPDAPEELRQRHRFPNKAGGSPAWLDPVSLPSGESRLCGFCGAPLRFALQVYAPFPAAYHRTLLVFMCPAMSCLLLDRREQDAYAGSGRRRRRRSSVKVFRCQLPRDNAFYTSGDGSGDDDDDDESDTMTTCTGVAAAPLCDWCGTWKAEAACAGGGGAKYCSEKHKEAHVRSGCSSGSVQEAGAVWPEYAMYTRPEEPPLNLNAGDTTPSSSSAQDPAGHIANDGAAEDDADDDETAAWMASFVEEDTARWAAFRARFSSPAQRGQVLRYCSEDGARPLWAAASGSLPDADAVPPCAHCGGAIMFEMQLMPQLLHYFRVEARDPDPLNWATVVVYTCARSCDGELSGGGGGAYKEEFAWLQLHAATTGNAGMEEAHEE